MKRVHDAFAGTLAIGLLVAAGFWYAHDPNSQSYFTSQGATSGGPGVTVRQLSWAAEGTKILSANRGGATSELQLVLHDLNRQGLCTPIDPIEDTVSATALAPDGQHALIGSYQGRLWWLEVDAPEPPSVLIDLGRRKVFSAVAIAAEGGLVAGGTNTGMVYLCDPGRRSIVELVARDRSSFRSLCFARNGKRLVGSQVNGRIVVWDVENGKCVQEVAGHQGLTMSSEFLSNGERIISAGCDDTVRIWDIASGRELWRGEFGQNGVNSLAVSSDGKTAAWGGFVPRIIVWDLERQQKKFEIAAAASSIYCLQFSPDGTTLAVGGTDELIRLYDARTGAETKRFEAVILPESL
jgi:WD40 repeat protein